jgi:hypothetical protein
VSSKKKKTAPKKKDGSAPKKLGGVTGRGFMPGASGNPGGRPKKLETLLSDAIREQLGAIDSDDMKTYATVIAEGMVKAAAVLAHRGKLSKELLLFFKEARDSTEGRPAQKIIVSGKLGADPVERVKQLLSGALERAAGTFSAG